MNCQNCNHPLGEKSKFCPECGAKLLSEPTPPPIDPSFTFVPPDAQPNTPMENAPEPNENKPKKKKSLKLLLIIGLPILSIIIIFVLLLIINPGCMFRHAESNHIIINSTCTQEGSEKYICKDCEIVIAEWTSDKLDHTWDTVSCDVDHTCVTCGTKQKLSHSENSDGVCRYCGKQSLSVTIKRNLNDLFIYEYDYSNNLSSAVSISDPIVTTYTDSIAVNYTITKIYDKYGDNNSSYGKVGWKLYNSKGVVVNSGTGYSKGQIMVGETSDALIVIQYLDHWEQYTLEITNVS